MSLKFFRKCISGQLSSLRKVVPDMWQSQPFLQRVQVETGDRRTGLMCDIENESLPRQWTCCYTFVHKNESNICTVQNYRSTASNTSSQLMMTSRLRQSSRNRIPVIIASLESYHPGLLLFLFALVLCLIIRT